MTTSILATETHDERISYYSDFFKEAYGFRPRHDTTSWTDADWAEEFRQLEETCRVNREAEERSERLAVEEFNQTIEKLIALGAKDRTTAIRWISQAEKATGSYLEFSLGLPYDFLGRPHDGDNGKPDRTGQPAIRNGRPYQPSDSRPVTGNCDATSR